MRVFRHTTTRRGWRGATGYLICQRGHHGVSGKIDSMKVAPLVSRILFVGGISLLLLFLAYFLHETVGVVQRAVGSTSQVLTDKANRLAIPAPIVVMVFLTKRGLEPTANIWNEWHADARRSLTRLGLNVDDFLRGVVHHHPNFTDTDIKLPDWLKPHVDPHPVTSEWGSLLPAMHKALSFAHEKNQDATYFIFVSETTVPLKSFTSIWSGIWADPRSRADAFCREHFNGNPKHSQWIMLNSRHAMYLIENEQWKTPRVNWVAGACGVGVAASDEYWPLRTIRHAPGKSNLHSPLPPLSTPSTPSTQPSTPSNRLEQPRSRCHPQGRQSRLRLITVMDICIVAQIHQISGRKSPWGV